MKKLKLLLRRKKKLFIKKREKRSIKEILGRFRPVFGPVLWPRRVMRRLSDAISPVEFLFLFTLFMTISFLIINAVRARGIVYSSVTVMEIVRREQGMRASMDFITLWNLILIIWTLYIRRNSADYPQGSITR